MEPSVQVVWKSGRIGTVLLITGWLPCMAAGRPGAMTTIVRWFDGPDLQQPQQPQQQQQQQQHEMMIMSKIGPPITATLVLSSRPFHHPEPNGTECVR